MVSLQPIEKHLRFLDNIYTRFCHQKQQPLFKGQLRMFRKLYLKVQWHTRGSRHPHIVIITICLYTFPKPHTLQGAKPQACPQRGETMQFSLISPRLTLSCGVRICRPRVESGHVWIQTCVLALEQKFSSLNIKECVPDCLHSVYRYAVCFHSYCLGMN